MILAYGLDFDPLQCDACMKYQSWPRLIMN